MKSSASCSMISATPPQGLGSALSKSKAWQALVGWAPPTKPSVGSAHPTFKFTLAILLLAMLVATVTPARAEGGPRGTIALLPPVNLSGAPIPVKEMQRELAKDLAKRGIMLLDEAELERFMAHHRVRYTGGIDDATAELLKTETGVGSVLAMSIQQYSTAYPPKIAVDLRLISTGAAPKIIWTDGVAMAGDDAPGLLGLGLIESAEKLRVKVLRKLSDSLMAGMATGAAAKPASRFRPKLSFSSPALAKSAGRIAVIPFANRSQRKSAGEILAVHFARELARKGDMTVVEPGVVRQKLLAYRVIMDEGLSLANADLIFQVLDVDLILTGDVMEYEDYEGSAGVAQVDFSARLFDRADKKIVWASHSHNKGDDQVYFFDRGKCRTAHGLAEQMVRGAVALIAVPPVTGGARNTTKQGTEGRDL